MSQLLERALNSCNVCDAEIKTPNPMGYCDDCLKQWQAANSPKFEFNKYGKYYKNKRPCHNCGAVPACFVALCLDWSPAGDRAHGFSPNYCGNCKAAIESGKLAIHWMDEI